MTLLALNVIEEATIKLNAQIISPLLRLDGNHVSPSKKTMVVRNVNGEEILCSRDDNGNFV